MKVKFFLESQLNTLETKMNSFIERKEIKNIEFQILSNSFIVVILYEE